MKGAAVKAFFGPAFWAGFGFGLLLWTVDIVIPEWKFWVAAVGFVLLWNATVDEIKSAVRRWP